MDSKRFCRLCLAPGDECVEIFENFAADRQRLDLKISSCVQIKVCRTDNLSHVICHACISYLNSWQSFKNRCDAAERKLRDTCSGMAPLCNADNIDPQKGLCNKVLDLSSENVIKKEPHENEHETDGMELDPSHFLMQTQEDVDGDYHQGNCQENGNLSKQIPDGFGNVSETEVDEEEGDSLNKQMLAACSVCDMTFSNRANARRHERNIHGLRQNPANPLSAQLLLDVGENVDTRPSMLVKPSGQPSHDIRQKIRTKLRAHREAYDYKNPAKYRHLITPNKLSFIMRNAEFLEQAQKMKCKCCNKNYPSYKYFMGHMRKKYPNLPRNVCFKCLRQFGSKGQFIGHLKRKACINLYQVYLVDESIPKELPDGAALGTKEVVANKSYGCKLCNKEFKPKINLRQHVLEVHPEVQNSKEIQGATSCAFCEQDFTEPALRKKHYGTLECLTFIVCASCGERFDKNSMFIEHVYQHHSPQFPGPSDEYLFDQDGNSTSSHLRNPQNCPVCDKQYNNYYNVLRHMESKHPNQLPQIYQCSRCPPGNAGFPRQSELRDHLNSVHGETSAVRQQKQQNLGMLVDSGRPSFVCKFCGKILAHLSEWIDHQTSDHGKFSCVRCEFKSDVREKFTVHCFIEHRNFCTSNQKIQLYSCRQCTNTYSSIDGLQEHIQKLHNTQNGDSNKSANDHGKVPALPETCTDYNDEAPATEDPSQQLMINRTLNCGLCAFVLRDIEALRQHMSEIHGMDKKFYYCNQCNAKYLAPRGLRVHLFRSHGVRDESTQVTTGASLLKPIQQAPATILPTSVDDSGSGARTKANECNICHIVYKNSEQLSLHVQLVHPPSDNKTAAAEEKIVSQTLQTPLLWFQCRYCAESFNSSKKLTLHLNNTHEEYDKSDHTCQDCGGIYGSKKSLWVHRYKKHPKIADASPCEICSRVFFDKMELFYHISLSHPAHDGTAESTEETEVVSYGQEFQEMQSASDALFSMLDTPAEACRRSSAQKSEETVYQCDMCPKTFLILNALQVHRGWHFRSPDGRKVRDPNDIWQPDQLPPSKVRRKQSVGSVVCKNPPTCPYCHSTFASTNNLKRHIVEVHKILHVKNLNVEQLQIPGASDPIENDYVKTGDDVSYANELDVNDAEDIQETHIIKEEQGQQFDDSHEGDGNDCSDDDGDGADICEQYFCELCQVHFTTANDLRQHVSEHFLNGGIEDQVSQQKSDNHRISTDSISSTNSSQNTTSSSDDSNSSAMPEIKTVTT